MSKAPSQATPSPEPKTENVTPAVGEHTAVVWSDARMATQFANVINIINTREEFSLFFGTNQTWNPLAQEGLVVELSNRIVVTPHAAKRLLVLLGERIADYEARFGKVDLGS